MKIDIKTLIVTTMLVMGTTNAAYAFGSDPVTTKVQFDAAMESMMEQAMYLGHEPSCDEMRGIMETAVEEAGADLEDTMEAVVDKDGNEHAVALTYAYTNTMSKQRCIMTEDEKEASKAAMQELRRLAKENQAKRVEAAKLEAAKAKEEARQRRAEQQRQKELAAEKELKRKQAVAAKNAANRAEWGERVDAQNAEIDSLATQLASIGGTASCTAKYNEYSAETHKANEACLASLPIEISNQKADNDARAAAAERKRIASEKARAEKKRIREAYDASIARVQPTYEKYKRNCNKESHATIMKIRVDNVKNDVAYRGLSLEIATTKINEQVDEAIRKCGGVAKAEPIEKPAVKQAQMPKAQAKQSPAPKPTLKDQARETSSTSDALNGALNSVDRLGKTLGGFGL